MLRRILPILIATSFALGTLPARSEVVVTEADKGKTVSVPAGQSLVVKLTGALGSGYYWRLDVDLTPQLILSGRSTVAVDAPGAPQTTVFTFTTGTVGTKVFKASYLKAGAPIPTTSDVDFTVNVVQ